MFILIVNEHVCVRVWPTSLNLFVPSKKNEVIVLSFRFFLFLRFVYLFVFF